MTIPENEHHAIEKAWIALSQKDWWKWHPCGLARRLGDLGVRAAWLHTLSYWISEIGHQLSDQEEAAE